MKKRMPTACLAMALLAGCDGRRPTPALPEINDVNCQLKSIKKIEDKTSRETFAGLCSRRSPTGGGITATEQPLNLLELADPKDLKGQGAKP